MTPRFCAGNWKQSTICEELPIMMKLKLIEKNNCNIVWKVTLWILVMGSGGMRPILLKQTI